MFRVLRVESDGETARPTVSVWLHFSEAVHLRLFLTRGGLFKYKQTGVRAQLASESSVNRLSILGAKPRAVLLYFINHPGGGGRRESGRYVNCTLSSDLHAL